MSMFIKLIGSAIITLIDMLELLKCNRENM